MQKSILILICSFFLLGHSFAQSNSVLKAFGNTDLAKLESLMNDKLEFCINDGQKSVDKQVALKSIEKFLNEVSPRSCRKVHFGDSKVKGSYYEVGKLKSDKGNYRVFIYYEKNKIVEIRIDNY